MPTSAVSEIWLPASAAAWAREDFCAIFLREAAALPAAALPLQQALQRSSAVADEPHQLRCISIREHEGRREIRAGVFYSGIIAGCNCADDPGPQDVLPEYCELLIVLAADGRARISLIDDGPGC